MLAHLAEYMASSAPTVIPTVTSLTVASLNGGACKSPRGTGVTSSATVRATWALANADWVNYKLLVYKDGVLRTTITTAGTTTDTYTITNQVLGDSGHSFTTSYVWRVDVVRVGDSAVVNSRSSATYAQDYGDCSGPA